MLCEVVYTNILKLKLIVNPNNVEVVLNYLQNCLCNLDSNLKVAYFYQFSVSASRYYVAVHQNVSVSR